MIIKIIRKKLSREFRSVRCHSYSKRKLKHGASLSSTASYLKLVILSGSWLLFRIYFDQMSCCESPKELRPPGHPGQLQPLISTFRGCLVWSCVYVPRKFSDGTDDLSRNLISDTTIEACSHHFAAGKISTRLHFKAKCSWLIIFIIAFTVSPEM